MARATMRSRLFVALLAATMAAPSLVPPALAADGKTPSAPEPLNAVPAALDRPAVPVALGAPGGGPTPIQTAAVRDQQAGKPVPSARTEVPGRRTENSRTFANPDGSFSQEFSAGRMNYLDAKGTWQPIDTTLITDEVNGYSLRTKANDIELRLGPDRAGEQLVQMAAKGHTVLLRVPGLVPAADAAGASKAVLAAPTAPESGVFEVIPTPEGFAVHVVLAEPSQATTYELILDPGDLTAVLAPDGRTILLTDSKGSIAGRVTPPFMEDAAGAAAADAGVTVTVERADGTTGLAPVDADGGRTALHASLSAAAASPDPSAATPSPSPSGSPSPSQTPGPVAEPEASPIEAPEDLSPSAPTPTAAPIPEPSAAPSPLASPTTAPVVEGVPTPDEIEAQQVLRASEVRLSYTIDPRWLAAPERVFPVTLDPTFTINPGGSGTTGCDNSSNVEQDTFVADGEPNNYVCWSSIRIGDDSDSGDGHSFGTMRGLLWFKTTGILGSSAQGGDSNGDGAHITAATLKLYKYYGNARTLKTAMLAGGDAPWGHTATWNDQQGEGGSNEI